MCYHTSFVFESTLVWVIGHCIQHIHTYICTAKLVGCQFLPIYPHLACLLERWHRDCWSNTPCAQLRGAAGNFDPVSSGTKNFRDASLGSSASRAWPTTSEPGPGSPRCPKRRACRQAPTSEQEVPFPSVTSRMSRLLHHIPSASTFS